MPKGESDSEWEGGDDKSSQDEHVPVAALGPALSERQLVLKQKAEVPQLAVVPVKGRPGRKKREAEVDVMESCWECQQEDAKVNDTMVFCESCERG